jgi:hypothetical protein
MPDGIEEAIRTETVIRAGLFWRDSEAVTIIHTNISIKDLSTKIVENLSTFSTACG